MISFRFRFDESFLVEAYRKHHASRRTYRMWRWTCYAIGISSFVAALLMWRTHDPAHVIFIGCITMLFGGSPWLGELGLRRNFRKSPFRDDEITLTLNDEGIVGSGDAHGINLSWKVVTFVKKLPDGFLVYSGPQHFRWLANRYQVDGTPEETDALLREKVEEYR